MLGKAGPDAKVVDKVEKREKANSQGIKIKNRIRQTLLRDQNCHALAGVEGQSIKIEKLSCKWNKSHWGKVKKFIKGAVWAIYQGAQSINWKKIATVLKGKVSIEFGPWNIVEFSAIKTQVVTSLSKLKKLNRNKSFKSHPSFGVTILPSNGWAKVKRTKHSLQNSLRQNQSLVIRNALSQRANFLAQQGNWAEKRRNSQWKTGKVIT